MTMCNIPSVQRTCFLCGSADQELVEDFSGSALFIEDNYYQIDIKKVLCNRCGLIYASHYPNQDYLRNLYVSLNVAPEILSYRFTAAPDHNEFFVNFLNAAYPSGTRKILDVGCGRCDTLDCFKSLGWETYGVDISPLSQQIGRERGHSVWCGPFQEIDFGDAKFQAILFEASLEHIPDPRSALRYARSLLDDTGHLGLSFPESYTCLMMKNVYDILREDHCNHFTPRTIQRLLMLEGLYLENLYLNEKAPVPDMKILASNHPANEPPAIVDLVELDQLKEAIDLYRKMKIKIRECFASKLEQFKRVVIYCTGTYTTIILPAFFGYNFFHCLGYIDNDKRKQGKILFGRTVFPHAQLKKLDPQAVLISSEVFEDEIYDALSSEMTEDIKLIRVNHLLREIIQTAS